MENVDITYTEKQQMVSVAQAEEIILANAQDWGTEMLPLMSCNGRILAEDIKADRDLPPYNRASMDGIAINYTTFEKGIRTFPIEATLAAGSMPIPLMNNNQCIEIMTGAAMPEGVDTVVRYEDVSIENNIATILKDQILKGQNVHPRGKDRKKHDVLVTSARRIDASVIAVAASVGGTDLHVKKLPRLVIISTGNELVDIDEKPLDWQIRSSNNYCIKAVLDTYGITVNLLHVKDDDAALQEAITSSLTQYDVIILSGGVSMGKFDYVPKALEKAGVNKHFHKVMQKPGKPFLFGTYENKVVFAFPGNPVSTYLCLTRYFIPWLEHSLGNRSKQQYAVLNKEILFDSSLTYFLQVKLSCSAEGVIEATPVQGNGSGDFVSLAEADAFIELPAEKKIFLPGESYRTWPFNQKRSLQ